MTELCEAVAYAIYCVGLEGLHTSLKPEEAFIYLYNDGRMVGMSELVPYRLCQVYGASNCCLLRQLDHTTIVEVYESLLNQRNREL